MATSSQEEHPSNPSHTKVLCVDDDADFLSSLVRMLANRGFQVKGAPNGMAAIAAIESGPAFDVMLLDVQMPGMDGIATLAEIRRLAPETQVLMLTGHADVSSGVQAMRSGAYDYLMKPCDAENLIQAIHAARNVHHIQRRPVLWHRNRVGEVRIETFPRIGPEGSLVEAVAALNEHRHAEATDPLYVVDAEDRLLGVVTRRDILADVRKEVATDTVSWTAMADRLEQMPRRPIASLMTPPPFTAHPADDLTQTAKKMMDAGCQSLAVIENGQMIGVVRLAHMLLHIQGHEQTDD